MKRTLLHALALLALHLPPAAAESPALTLSGFATLGLVSTRADDLRFARIGIDAPGDDDPDPGPDSVLGLQANLRLGEDSAAVLQVLTRETPRGDHDPRPSLAFLSHRITPELTARLGRLRIPFFMLSDSIDINYSHPWVRPPVEVYGLNPFSDLDGLDLLLRTRIGDTDLEVHPYLGRSTIPVVGGGRARLSRLVGLAATLSTDALSVTAGHAVAELGVQRDSAASRALVAALPPAVASRLAGSGARATFSSIGFQWDDGHWLLAGELARTTAARFSSSAHGWMLTAGRHIGPVTPYLTLARQYRDEAIIDPAVAALDPRLAFFNRLRNQAQRSVTAGVRWDVADEVALKTEFSRIHVGADAWGSFFPVGNAATARQDDRSINVLSLSVDVVF